MSKTKKKEALVKATLHKCWANPMELLHQDFVFDVLNEIQTMKRYTKIKVSNSKSNLTLRLQIKRELAVAG